jgi:hypothetical protein
MDWTAIATLILAGVTMLLVLGTFKLASQSAEDVRAQWRPILLVRDSLPTPTPQFPQTALGIVLTDSGLSVYVENAGRGPALGTRATLAYEPPPPGGQGRSISVGEIVGFHFELTENRDHFEGRLDYSDISKAGYITRFLIVARRSPGSDDRPDLLFQDVEIVGPLFAWWQNIIRRPLRHYALPLTKRRLRRLGYKLD